MRVTERPDLISDCEDDEETETENQTEITRLIPVFSETIILLFNLTYNHNIHRSTDYEEHADKQLQKFLVVLSHIVCRSKVHNLF